MTLTCFTRFQMNPRRRGTAHLLASPQRLHAAVLSCYPPDLTRDTKGSRVLWRVDVPSKHESNLFIVGRGRPSLEGLAEQSGWTQEPSWRTTDYQPFLDRLRDGQRWTFRLAANPTRSRAGERGTRGSVSPHVTADQQLTWLLDRARRHGFAPVETATGPNVRVTKRDRVNFGKRSPEGGRQVVLSRVQFDGVLEVLDEELLRTALVNGIGRAKAYGCGLLTLAPAP